jgi:hypothetical protein
MNIPICNTETEEIINCKKGTPEYKHEEAHIDFSKSNQGKVFLYLAEISQFYTILSLVLAFFFDFFKYFAALGGVLMLFFFIYEEIFCKEKENGIKT